MFIGLQAAAVAQLKHVPRFQLLPAPQSMSWSVVEEMQQRQLDQLEIMDLHHHLEPLRRMVV
jgi:hypothetical protein